MTAGSSYACDDRVPDLIQDQRDGSWRQRDKIITKGGDFGRGRAGGRPRAEPAAIVRVITVIMGRS